MTNRIVIGYCSDLKQDHERHNRTFELLQKTGELEEKEEKIYCEPNGWVSTKPLIRSPETKTYEEL